MSRCYQASGRVNLNLWWERTLREIHQGGVDEGGREIATGQARCEGVKQMTIALVESHIVGRLD